MIERSVRWGTTAHHRADRRFLDLFAEDYGIRAFYAYSLEGVPKKQAIAVATWAFENIADEEDRGEAVRAWTLREEGLVSWHGIVDETRSLHNPHRADTVAEATADMVGRMRKDPWEGTRAPLILCESRSLSGVLSQMAQTYCAPLAATNGQTGGFLHTDVGPLVQEDVLEVLYFGDLDFSGGHIEANTRRVLETYEPGLAWSRLAIYDAQVRERGLSVMSKYDKRTKTYHDAVETEALSQGEIVRLLTEALDERLPRPLSETRREESAERAQVRSLLEAGS